MDGVWSHNKTGHAGLPGQPVMSIKNFSRGGSTMERIKRFLKDEEGVTALEYGMIAAATCVAIAGALLLLSPALTGVFTTVTGAL